MKPKNCFEVFSTKTNTIRVWRKKTSLRRALAAARSAICHFLRDSSCCIGPIHSIRTHNRGQSIGAFGPAEEFKDASSPSALTSLKSQTLEAPYHPMTSGQSLRWLIPNTIGPSHLAGGILLSGFGTALDRPKEYGPHWGGFADRYGMRKTSIATGNVIEASASLILREDPRYFRVPGRTFKARVGNVVRLTFPGPRRRLWTRVCPLHGDFRE